MAARVAIFIIIAALLGAGVFFALRGCVFQRTYSGGDFGVETYISPLDTDGDGLDDQTDILRGARDYVATRPRYKSKYYTSGWPDDGYGVCTDVVARALLAAGYDLRTLVDEDIRGDPAAYGIEKPDSNIDFRRVVNLNVYFSRHATSLTTDPDDIASWQGGDIVVFPGHIGIVSDKRDRHGVPYLIHHANPAQTRYEENALRRHEIVGHYRVG